MQNVVSGYPPHNKPASKKDKAWIQQFIMAAYREIQENKYNVFYGKRYVYQEIKSHTQGSQPINKYKKQLNVDESEKDSWYAINWKPLPIVPRLRRMALSSIGKRQHDVQINPLDPRLQAEKKRDIRKIEDKLRLKEAVSQVSPELANMPQLQPGPNEPQDLYEVEVYREFGYKHNIVAAMEKVNKIILLDNEYETNLRDIIDQQQMDYGVCILKQDTLPNGRIHMRVCSVPNVVTSYFSRPDAQDARFIGEIVPYSVEEIRAAAGDELTSDDHVALINTVSGKYGNGSYHVTVADGLSQYDTMKCAVLDIEFKSINQVVFEERTDRRGNKIARINKDGRLREKNEYDAVDNGVIYTGKWVIGTNILYGYGPKTNMPKSPENLTDCSYSYKIQCTNLNDMSVVSKMEEAMSVDDQIQIAWFKMQHEIATNIPNGWWIDPDGLAQIAVGDGHGGEVWNQKKVLDLFFKRGLLIAKKKNIQGKIDPSPPISPLPNDSMASIEKYLSLIGNHISFMRQIIGVNEYVDGQNIDSRTLKNVTEMAQDALNNSLFDIVAAERKMLHAIAKENVLRVLDLIEMDALPMSYIKALGEQVYGSLQDIEDISSYMMSVEIEMVANEYERQAILARLAQYAASGLVEPSDEAVIMSTRSIKAAWAILEARFKKRKEEKMKESMMLSQQNAQASAMAGQAVEAAKAETAKMQGEIKAMLEAIKGEFMVKGKEITATGMVESAQVRSAKD